MASIAVKPSVVLRKPPARTHKSSIRFPSHTEPTSKARQLERQEMEKLLLLHLPQVRLIAENIRNRLRFNVELDDLISYGVIGMMKAVERFDPSRGVLLKTYAEHRIRGAILDGLRGMDWLSRSARQKERQYQQSLYRAEEASAASGSNSAGKPGDTPNNGGSGSAADSFAAPPRVPLMEVIYAGWELEDLEEISERTHLRDSAFGVMDNPATLYERQEMRRRLARAVSGLPRRHREVIYLYYYQELSMRQIGVILKVHESRVSQLHSLAIERLRNCLSDHRRGENQTSGCTQKAGPQPPRRKPSKYRVTACKSSSVSTPMVSMAVSAT